MPNPEHFVGECITHIRDVLDKMQGLQYYTTLDAALAYWSMPLKEADKEKQPLQYRGENTNLMLCPMISAMPEPHTRE